MLEVEARGRGRCDASKKGIVGVLPRPFAARPYGSTKVSKLVDAFTHRANQRGCFSLTVSSCTECIGKLLVRESREHASHPPGSFNRYCFEGRRVFTLVMEANVAVANPVQERLVSVLGRFVTAAGRRVMREVQLAHYCAGFTESGAQVSHIVDSLIGVAAAFLVRTEDLVVGDFQVPVIH